MRAYGKTIKTSPDGKFEIVQVLDENGEVAGYAVLGPGGEELFYSDNLEDVEAEYERLIKPKPPTPKPKMQSERSSDNDSSPSPSM